MSQPFVGQLLLVGFNFAPVGWAFCAGQTVSIPEYTPLFTLLGTTFGGDGINTLGLPDLRGRVPVHQGTGRSGTSYAMGSTGGVELVTIVANTYPQHTHNIQVTGTSNVQQPAGSIIAGGIAAFSQPGANPVGAMAAGTIGQGGGNGEPHDNMQPWLALNWIISLYGVFPTRD